MLSDISHTEKDKYCLWSLKQKLMRLVTQLCQTLCDSMDCSLPGSSVHGDYPGKNTGVGCHALRQGIFPTQGLNPSPALQADSLPLSHLESPGAMLEQGGNLRLLETENNFFFPS